MILSQEFMSLEEACKESGLTKWGLYPHIKAGAFLASLPFGRTGGWHISRHSFHQWLMGRIGAGANRAAVPKPTRRGRGGNLKPEI